MYLATAHKLGFRINNCRKESVLPQSTATFVFPVDVLCVKKICPADAAGQ